MIIKSIVTGSYYENCYFLIEENTGKAIIIDPGADFEAVKKAIDDYRTDVECVLITHGHFDHTDSLKQLTNNIDAPIYMNLLDKPLLKNPEITIEDIKDGDTFSLGNTKVYAIATPGHSEGGMCFLCGGDLFSGDTLFQGSVGRTDLPGGSYPVLINSIKSRLMALPDDITVYPGHGGTTTIGHERATNPFLV